MQNKKPSPFVFQARKSIDHDQEWVTASWTAPQRWSGDRENRASRSRAVGALIFLRPLDMSELNRTVGVTKPLDSSLGAGENTRAGQRRSTIGTDRLTCAVFAALTSGGQPKFHRFVSWTVPVPAACRHALSAKGIRCRTRPRSGLAVRKRKLREPLRLAHSLTRALQ